MYGLGNITVTISNTLMPKFQGLRSNGLGFVPMKSPSGNAFELEYVPISKIQTDEKNFQNRADKYSEKSVNAILKAVKNGTFNWFAFDPVLLWKNPSGDLIVLSGHSRTEAFRRLAAERPKIEIDGLSFDKIPAKIFKGDFVNAKNLALNSNALSTPETLLERADFYRNQRELLNNKSDIAKLREKAVRENQGSVIWDLSFLPADGLTVDSLKRFKMQEDSEAAFENYVRAVNIAQWIGKAFQIYKGLSRLHDSELFKFLLNNYGTKSGQYNSFAKLNERLQVLYPRNVKNAEKTDLDGNYTTPFGLVIYEKNDDEINEIQELESEAKKAKRELDKKIKDLRGRAADKAQIFEIVTPHFNEYVNKLFDWWNSLDREKVRKTDKNQGALFGCLSQMIDDYSVNDNDVLCAGLGKPTVKFEFEDNDEIFKTFGNLQGLTVNDKPAWIFNCPESMLKTNGFKPTYKRLLSYDALIFSSDGNKTLVGYGFNKSTLDELKEACKYYKQVEKLAAHLKADSEAQSAFNVWHWLHCNINYNYDKAGEEEIRTPARTWADRKSGVDCDCLAVFTACLFICMGYRPRFEIVAFHNSPQYSHIYVNLNGLAVDRVLPVFGIRPSFITKKYLMEIPVYHLSGIDGCMNGLQGVYESTLSKIFSKTATPEDSLNFRKAQVLITLQNVDPDAYKLGAIIMPHVQAIGDDGAYYFDNEYVAKVAKQLDSDLQQRHLNGIYGLGKGWLKKAIKKVGNAVKKVAKSTANAAKTVAKATANTVKAAAKSTVNAVKATANVTKAAAQAVTGNAKKAKETLKKAATQVKAAAIAPIKQAAKDTKSVVKNAVVQPVKTVTQVTLINPIKDTVKIAGKLFKVLLVKLNPALILIRSGLKLLIAINFLGMATRFSIGLLTQAEAEQKGYDKDTWESAKKAVDKIVRFWKKIGGKEDKLLKTIRNGSTRKALFKKNYNKNTKIVETGEDSATLGAVEIKILNGINGLGEGFTIGTALAAVGAFFAKIWGWIKKIVPKVGEVVKKIASSNAVQTAAQFIKGQNGKSTDTPDNSLVDHNISSDTKPNWMPWAFAAAALGVGIFAFSGKKKKKRA